MRASLHAGFASKWCSRKLMWPQGVCVCATLVVVWCYRRRTRAAKRCAVGTCRCACICTCVQSTLVRRWERAIEVSAYGAHSSCRKCLSSCDAGWAWDWAWGLTGTDNSPACGAPVVCAAEHRPAAETTATAVDRGAGRRSHRPTLLMASA